jgi:hypothetical protein
MVVVSQVKDEYSLVLTLTDGHLGEGNFITQSLLLLVEDVNDNEPIFKPYQSTISIREDSTPHILTTVEATDQDEGPYGQVNISLLVTYHHTANSVAWHNSYECHLHLGSS